MLSVNVGVLEMDGELGTSSSAASDPVGGVSGSSSLSQGTYDCCICSLSTQSTFDRLIGLVGLLQPTNCKCLIGLVEVLQPTN